MSARHATRKTSWRSPGTMMSIIMLIASGASSSMSPAFADSTTSSPTPTVIDIPALPTDAVNDPCGRANAAWNDLVDQTGEVSYTKPDGHLVATIVPADTVFTDNTTSHDYGLAPDSNVACPTPPPPPPPTPKPTQHHQYPSTVPLTARQRGCLNGTTSTAHRGSGFGSVRLGGRWFTEDTLSAELKGLSFGVCGGEWDVQESADHCGLVHHDPTPMRMTGHGGPFRQHSCSWATHLRNKKSGTRINTLGTMVCGMARAGAIQQQELKPGLSLGLRKQLIALDNRCIRQPKLVLFTASEIGTQCSMKTIDPRYATALINRSKYGWFNLSAVASFHRKVYGDDYRCIDVLNVDYRALSPSRVAAAHRMGFQVSARNVDTVGRYYLMKGWKVDRIVTNKSWVIRGRR